jgi:hypothetical protein
VDAAVQADLRAHFSDDQILDLGMTVAFFSGWQRFIEAFGIVPDRWADGSPSPFRALSDEERGVAADRPAPAERAAPAERSERNNP